MRRVIASLAASVVLAAVAQAAPPQAKNAAVIDPAKADADFKVQGEYTGQIAAGDRVIKFGAQIIALGGGKFLVVGFEGGLPGAGWNGDKRKGKEVDGQTTGGVTTFKDEDVAGTFQIQDGVLTIRDAGEEVIGKLKRVIRKSSTLGAKPPKGAVVLFDGSTAKHFPGSRLTAEGLLSEGATSQRTFQSFQLHLEFLLSYVPYARGQARSNSGCYMQGRYEVQILDSFGLDATHHDCGGIYETSDPLLNMCFPPLSWQTYDVDFTAAKYDKAGKKLAHARMTVRHNGQVVQNNVELPKATRANPVPEGPGPGPIYIQNHGNPLRFRNIWLVEGKASAESAKEDGFESLFDGKTLAGWHKNPKRIGHGSGGSWSVENGAIVGEQDPPGSGNGGILLTDRKFGNFELLIDMKPDWGVCSGLFLRGNDRGQCFQMMVDYHDAGNVGHIYGEGTGGFHNRPFDIFGRYQGDDKSRPVALFTKPSTVAPPKAFSISGPAWVKAWKLGDWNTARVRCVGNPPQITTWINGVKVSEFDGTTFPSPQYDKAKVSQLLGSKGSIAVQVHGGGGWPKGAKCRWRNIRIKPLD